MTGTRARIVVRSARHEAEHLRLLADLEFSVDVEVSAPTGPADVGAAVVAFDVAASEVNGVAEVSVPVLAHISPSSGPVRPYRLTFASSDLLDPRLRGAQFDMVATPWAPVPQEDGDVVLAHVDGAPVWVRRAGDRTVEVAGLRPDFDTVDEKWEQEAERLVGAIPAIHFIRSRGGHSDSRRYPQLACFIVDDPNLHWPSYGHLRYRDLIEHARRRGFHVSIATIPLDARFHHSEVVELFRRNPDSLSLSIHGNNHTKGEFATLDSERLLRSLAQSLRRIRRFEQRTGLDVDRVVVPPHGALSHELGPVCARLGIEAISASPWAVAPAQLRSGGRLAMTPTVGMPNGAPMLVRRHMVTERAWLPLHAFLDQPAVVYLHHEDVMDGLDLMDVAADEMARLAQLRWCSLAEMSRASYTQRTEGAVSVATMFSPRIRFRVPDGVEAVVVRHALIDAPATIRISHAGAETSTELGLEVAVPSGEIVDILLENPDRVDAATVPPPDEKVWPIARRVMTESRDRLRPLLSRVRTVS